MTMMRRLKVVEPCTMRVSAAAGEAAWVATWIIVTASISRAARFAMATAPPAM